MGFFDYLTYHFIRDVQHEKNEKKRKEKSFYRKRMQECATDVADFGQAILTATQKLVYEDDPMPPEFSSGGLCEAFLFGAASISRRYGLTDEQIKIVELMENSLKDGISAEKFRRACVSKEDLKSFYPLGYLEKTSCGRSMQRVFSILTVLTDADREFNKIFDHLSSAFSNYCFCGNLEGEGQEICENVLNNAYLNFRQAKEQSNEEITFYTHGSLECNLEKINAEFNEIAEKSHIRSDIPLYDLMIQYLWAKTSYDMTVMGDVSESRKKEELKSLFSIMNIKVALSADMFIEDIENHGEVGKFVLETYTVSNGQLPVFWQVVQSAALKGNDQKILLEICKDFREICLNIMARLENRYPKQGYNYQKAQTYSMNVIKAFSEYNKS